MAEALAPSIDTNVAQPIQPPVETQTQPLPVEPARSEAVTPEQTRSVLQSRENEIGIIGSSILNKMIDKIDTNVKADVASGLTDSELETKYPGLYAITDLQAIQRFTSKQIEDRPQNFDMKLDKGISLRTKVDKRGLGIQEGTIVSAESVIDENGQIIFDCKLTFSGGIADSNERFTKEQLVEIMLVNRRQVFEDAVTDDPQQKELLSIKIDLLEGNQDRLTAENIDTMIAEVARNAKMNTRDVWEALIDNIDPMSIPGVGGEGVSPAKAALDAAPLKAQAKQDLGERFLVDPADGVKALKNLGLDSEKYAVYAKTGQKQLDRLQARLTDLQKIPQSQQSEQMKLELEDAYRDIAEAKLRIETMEAMSKVLEENGIFIQALRDMDNGNLLEADVDIMRQFMREGNLEGFAEATLKGYAHSKGLEERDIDARIQEEKDRFEKNGKKLPHGLLWSILLFVGNEIYNSVTQAA